MRMLLLLICMIGYAPVFAAELPDDALGWLTSMREARKHLSFRGTAALLRDSQVQMVTVAHVIENGMERDSMHSLDDPGQKIVRQSARITYFLPETKRSLAGTKVLRVGDFSVLPEDLTGYQRNYRFSLGAQESLIGRMAQEVVIEPADEYRYSRRFWIDIDNKLPLKYQVLNNGKVLEQLVFSELSLAGAPPYTQSADDHSYTQESLPLESLQWRLERVPPGYRLVSYMRHSAPDKKPLEHLLLSDGLSALSLYIEETDNSSQIKPQVRHFGAIHLYLRSIGRYQVTVMGEAPLAAVGLVGESVRRVGQP